MNQQPSWREGFYEKYERLITHPSANSLKDFISKVEQEAYERGRREVVKDMIKLTNDLKNVISENNLWPWLDAIHSMRHTIKSYAKSNKIEP